ncbi:MAG: class I SAM-dependent methyltransferase [Tepidisphaeraceae bacterium]
MPEQPSDADLAALKQRQQAMWASGDFSVVAARFQLASELLCEAIDVQAGRRVLDVATGSGNRAIAAARRDCEVVGVDYVPALLERGRLRADVEHLRASTTATKATAAPLRSWRIISKPSSFAPDSD